MTHQQVDQAVTQYLALTTWAQATMDIARHNPDHLAGAMLWRQDTSCIKRFAELRQTEPRPDPRTPLRCARQALIDLDDSRWWQTTSAPARQARARYQLRNLWQAVNPATRLAARAAAVHRLDVTGPGNNAFTALTNRYTHCQEADRRTASLAAAGTKEQLAQEWLESALQMQECAHRVTHTPLAADPGHLTEEDP